MHVNMSRLSISVTMLVSTWPLAAWTDDKVMHADLNWMAVRPEVGTDLHAVLLWAISLGTALFFILGGIVFWNRRLKRDIKERREMEDRLNLALAGGDLGFWDVNLANGDLVVNGRSTGNDTLIFSLVGKAV
ncbi:MAG: hypothetical protein HQL62_10275, partial [Magnetococcales bacterium]|nr:hypothetical protein [Magnetococcales bacterium]